MSPPPKPVFSSPLPTQTHPKMSCLAPMPFDCLPSRSSENLRLNRTGLTRISGTPHVDPPRTQHNAPGNPQLTGNNDTNIPAPPQANPPLPNNPRPAGTVDNRPSLRLRANITIATLNINGYTAPASNMTGIEKWSAINRTINDNHIAILALQETHLDQDSLQRVKSCFGGRLKVVTSHHPDNPRATAGVAFVLNKSMINPSEYTLYELVPGRAAALKIKWLENKESVLLNVYAPNDRSEQIIFWDSINEKRQSLRLRRPDFMLGDFNMMEERLDQAPAHLDDLRAMEALRTL